VRRSDASPRTTDDGRWVLVDGRRWRASDPALDPRFRAELVDARAIGGTGWRRLLDPVRDVVRDLGRDGQVTVTQRGAVLDPDAPWKGAIRIAVRPPASS